LSITFYNLAPGKVINDVGANEEIKLHGGLTLLKYADDVVVCRNRM